jgi:transcriptional regulator with XRE-family HTH domain
VGGRLRLRRILLGLTQEKLAEAVGLTFQQIQKYEKGLNRIGAGRLYQFCRVLDVPPAYFYNDMPPAMEDPQGPVNAERMAGGARVAEADTFGRRETLELVRAYYKIHDSASRRRIFELVKAMASVSEPET